MKGQIKHEHSGVGLDYKTHFISHHEGWNKIKAPGCSSQGTRGLTDHRCCQNGFCPLSGGMLYPLTWHGRCQVEIWEVIKSSYLHLTKVIIVIVTVLFIGELPRKLQLCSPKGRYITFYLSCNGLISSDPSYILRFKLPSYQELSVWYVKVIQHNGIPRSRKFVMSVCMTFCQYGVVTWVFSLKWQCWNVNKILLL